MEQGDQLALVVFNPHVIVTGAPGTALLNADAGDPE